MNHKDLPQARLIVESKLEPNEDILKKQALHTWKMQKDMA